MKKIVLPCLLCVFFLMLATIVGVTYCFQGEHIEFIYGEKVFDYFLDPNIKTSSRFDLNYEINKYNRFGLAKERVELLNKMLSLGFEKSVAVDYLFPNLTKKINSIAKNIYVAPKDAELKINSNNEHVFLILPETIGIELDKNKLFNNICNNYINQKTMKFNLPIKKSIPKVTKKDYEKFTNLRADFSTNISTSSSDRKHNIKNALTSLNKIKIAPNQIFSFNNIVGRRTAENGYREAKIIVNNEFVDGLGGGVCQVSSTLYNAVLMSGLEIIEANKHSKQVNYVMYGFDAMVNFGSSDLKFRNNTNETITIIANYSANNARIRIYGENLNNTSYKLTNEILNVVEPTEEILIDEHQQYLDKIKYEDEYFYLRKANKGMEIKSYRETYKNNQLVSKELLRHDKFKVQNSVKVFGSQKREEEIFN